MRVVTGIGPRVGTSFTMNFLRKNGLPIAGKKFLYFTPKDENPDGFWELDPQVMEDGCKEHIWKNMYVKVWPALLLKTPVYNINRLLILERKDKERQLESVNRIYKKEKEIVNFTSPFNPPTDIIDWSRWCLTRALEEANYPILHVYTEDINDKLDEILSFMED